MPCPRTQQANLPACCPQLSLNAERQAGKLRMPFFKVFWYDSTRGMNPRSTDCKADALTTTPSRRFQQWREEVDRKPVHVSLGNLLSTHNLLLILDSNKLATFSYLDSAQNYIDVKISNPSLPVSDRAFDCDVVAHRSRHGWLGARYNGRICGQWSCRQI